MIEYPLKWIFDRRSIRSFRPDPIEENKIDLVGYVLLMT